MKAELYKKFFENSTEGLAVVSADGTIELANNAMAEIFGYSTEELTGKSVDELVPMENRTGHDKLRSSYYSKPEYRPMGKNRNLYGLMKDGSKVPLEIALSPVNIDGEIKTAVLLSDITERVKSQAEIEKLNKELQDKVEERTSDLLKSQQLYSLISQNFPNGTINVFDKNLNYVFVEGQELNRMGVDKAIFIGTNYLDRLDMQIRGTIEEKLTSVFKGEDIKFELEHKDQYYELTAVPLRDKMGGIDQILVVERNITEEKMVQQEVEKALAKERELNELKSRFVSMASHEFRTPLTTINSSATLISKYEHTEDHEKRLKHVKRIKSSISHLTAILNDILSLSKLEEGKIDIKKEIIDTASFYDDIKEQMELVADGKVKIQIHHDGNNEFTSDPNLIRNLLVNLLSNAIKYSYEGGKVELNSTLIDGTLSIEIKDEGIGIPIEDQKKLFDRFFRASNVTNIEGTGLGLNIVKRFVDLLKGNISFESIPDKHTVFIIKIPL